MTKCGILNLVQLLNLRKLHHTDLCPPTSPLALTERLGSCQQLWVVTASSDTCNEYYNGYDLYTVPARRALYNTHLYTGLWETIIFRGIRTCYGTLSIARPRRNVTTHTTTTLGKCFLYEGETNGLSPRGKNVDYSVKSSILQTETALYSVTIPSA